MFSHAFRTLTTHVDPPSTNPDPKYQRELRAIDQIALDEDEPFCWDRIARPELVAIRDASHRAMRQYEMGVVLGNGTIRRPGRKDLRAHANYDRPRFTDLSWPDYFLMPMVVPELPAVPDGYKARLFRLQDELEWMVIICRQPTKECPYELPATRRTPSLPKGHGHKMVRALLGCTASWLDKRLARNELAGRIPGTRDVLFDLHELLLKEVYLKQLDGRSGDDDMGAPFQLVRPDKDTQIIEQAKREGRYRG